MLTVEFTVAGIPSLGLNGGPAIKHNQAVSFRIATDDQAEIDRLWRAVVGNVGQERARGWCQHRWGPSRQITPRALMAAIADPDRAVAKRAFEARMPMGTSDIGLAARLDARQGFTPCGQPLQIAHSAHPDRGVAAFGPPGRGAL